MTTAGFSLDHRFFIVGCPRSGTTLLSVLLDRHSRLCIPPETGFFDEVAPHLLENDSDSLLKVLRRWGRLIEMKVAPEDILRRLGEPPWPPNAALAAILDQYAQNQGKLRCGEKTPHHLNHLSTIFRSFPGAKVVCMLRDGRDVALSLAAMPWWWPQNLEDAARLWQSRLQLMEKFISAYPTQLKVVRYENLVLRPEETLNSVMEFIGEKFEPSQLQPDVRSGVVLPRSMEWKGQALERVDVNGAGKRRREASSVEVAMLDELLKKDLRRYKYSPSLLRKIWELF